MKRIGLAWTAAGFSAAILLGAPAFAEDSRTGTAGSGAPGQGAPAAGIQNRDTTRPTNRIEEPADMGSGAAGDAPDDMDSGNGDTGSGTDGTGAGSGGHGAGGGAGS